MNQLRNLCYLILVLFLFACGGGKQSIEIPEERPFGHISGSVSDGSFRNSKITLYTLDKSENRHYFTETTLDEAGDFQLEVQAPSQPMLLELSGGYYIEPANEIKVELHEGHFIGSPFFYESGEDHNVNITPFTHLSSALALHNINIGQEKTNALENSLEELFAYYDLNLQTTKALFDVETLENPEEISDELRYGLMISGLSVLSQNKDYAAGNNHSASMNTLNLIEIMFRDIVEDGLLDGKGIDQTSMQPVDLAYALHLLGDDFYQLKFAGAIIQTELFRKLKQDENNELLKTFIYELANSDVANFDKTTIKARVSTEPKIAVGEEIKAFYQGKIQLPISVSDILKLKSVQYYVDDVLIENPAGLNDETVEINSQDYTDGEHLLKIVAFDEFNHQGEKTVALMFDNTSPSASVTSQLITNQKSIRIAGNYTEGGSGIKSVIVNGNYAFLEADGGWIVDVVLEIGKNTLEIEVMDNVGNTDLVQAVAFYDTQPPQIISGDNHSEAKFVSSEGLYYLEKLTEDNQTPLYVEIDHLDLNGAAREPEAMTSAEIPYFAFTVNDPIQNGAVTDSKKLLVKYQYEKNGQAEDGWNTFPVGQTEFFLPLSRELLGLSWQNSKVSDLHVIRVQVEDEAGNTSGKTFSFYSAFYVPPVEIKIAEENANSDWSTSTFAERAQFNNSQQAAVSYELFNSTEQAFYLRLNDTAAHQIEHQYESVKREHKVNLNTTQEWRIGNVANSYAECPTFNGQWTYVDHVWNYDESGKFVKMLPEEIAPVTEYVNTNAPTAPGASDWRDFVDRDNQFATANEVGETEVLTFSYDYLLQNTITYKTQPAYVSNWQLKAKDTGEIIKDCSDTRNFQMREIYEYVSADGFPKNKSSIEATSDIFYTSGFKVFDEDGSEINKLEGWFRIPANHRVVITKYVSTPDLEIFDDPEVSAKESITDYETYKLDSSIRWTIKQGFMADFTFNPPNLDFNAATIRGGDYTFDVSRYLIER